MIIIACKDCGTAVRITGEHAELEHLLGEYCDWYPNKYPCPSVGCGSCAEFQDAVAPAALRELTMYDLTPHEAYAAFHGLGLPEERDCNPTAVEKALVGKTIRAVHVALVRGSNRSVIYNLTTEDGAILSLGSSPFGAVVYRMSKTQSAVERVDGD